jgi:hypothetical protein
MNYAGKSIEPSWRGAADPGRLDYLKSLYDCAADFLEHGQRTEAVDSLVECLTGLYELLNPPLDLITRQSLSAFIVEMRYNRTKKRVTASL